MSISMIPCDSDCIYQQDGYCSLEIPTIITDLVHNGCVHRIQACPNSSALLSLKHQTSPLHFANRSLPQTHPEPTSLQ